MRKLFLIIATMMQSLILSALTNDLPDIDMVLVEGGTFIMGFNEDETDHAYESPKHEEPYMTIRLVSMR